MNWSPITIVATPLTGAPVTVTLTEIVDVDPDISTRQEMFYGDTNKFPRIIANVEKKRSLTITSGDIYKLLTIPEDSTCVITATLNDVKNGSGAGGGGIQLVLSNAVRESADFKSPNNKIGTGSVKFNAFAVSDADPLVITQL
jgi:hypothetical protein